MFIKKYKKDRVRYPGTDLSPWKVVTFEGKELGRYESFKIEETDEVIQVWVTRWNGFRKANAAAQRLGGVAVRA